MSRGWGWGLRFLGNPLSAGCYSAFLLWIFASGCLMAGTGTVLPSLILPPPLLQKTQATYGPQANSRLVRWQELVGREEQAREWHRLLRINHYLNAIPFEDDQEHWGEADFWATPVQFLASNGGDCEDYAIAKLFSLTAARIAPEKLRLAYVNATTLNQPHMVLLYAATPWEHPVVLDNLTKEVIPARERTDLVPVYSFNASGLWINRQLDGGTKVRNRPGSSLWRELLDRIQLEGVFE